MHKLINKISAGVIILLLVAPIVLLVIPIACYDRVYETNEIADYGKIKGNFDNNTPKSFIFSFFPQTLDDAVSDVTYHYKAKTGDTYAYECYLEFTIEDKSEFTAFLDSHVQLDKSTEFRYDDTLMDYTVSNILDTDWTSVMKSGGYSIGYAEIGKILYNTEEQRIIFFALGVYDGGGTSTAELDYFFTKYDIDIIDYQLNAFYYYLDQENNITYSERFELGMETPYPHPYAE